MKTLNRTGCARNIGKRVQAAVATIEINIRIWSLDYALYINFTEMYAKYDE